MIIRNKDRDRLITIFDSLNGSFQVWAFGSRVSGSAHEGSDLNLVIRTADLNRLPLPDYLRLVEEIRESNIPIVVELHDWARLPDVFHKNIMAQYEILYSKNA